MLTILEVLEYTFMWMDARNELDKVMVMNGIKDHKDLARYGSTYNYDVGTPWGAFQILIDREQFAARKAMSLLKEYQKFVMKDYETGASINRGFDKSIASPIIDITGKSNSVVPENTEISPIFPTMADSEYTKFYDVIHERSPELAKMIDSVTDPLKKEPFLPYNPSAIPYGEIDYHGTFKKGLDTLNANLRALSKSASERSSSGSNETGQAESGGIPDIPCDSKEEDES